MQNYHLFCIFAPKIGKMTFHIFNPEHDIALAANLSNFTAPHAGRQLRHDLGFLPALWAADGDKVLVDDVELARRSLDRVAHAVRTGLNGSLLRGNREFAPWKQGVCSVETACFEPWGWNRALKGRLERVGADERLLPSDACLDDIRLLSHRRTAAALLPQLRREGTVGEVFECRSQEEVAALTERFGCVVLKAPWSSSGRGLRFVSSETPLTPHVSGWLNNLFDAQGAVMVEPYYNKVKDFGMEFECSDDGVVRYLGLSLFHTSNGAYKGNILATENVKRSMLSRYLSMDLIDSVKQDICERLSSLLKGRYAGPLGIDMMVCAPGALHPCVEINLRRTMGHVALALQPDDDDIQRVMRIEYSENRYKLKLQRL